MPCDWHEGSQERFGLGPGDRIAILGSNAPDWVVAFWAVVAMDGVVVPLNAWWKATELSFGLEDSETALAFCDARARSNHHRSRDGP